MPSHRAFLRSCFGMHIDHSNFHIVIKRTKQLVGNAKRIISPRHEYSPQEVDDGDPSPFYLTNPHTVPRSRGRIIGRPQKPRLVCYVVDHLVLIKNVIAGSHDVDTRREQQLSNPRRNRKTAGDIFRVDNREVDLMLLFKILQTIDQGSAPGLAANTTDEKN